MGTVNTYVKGISYLNDDGTSREKKVAELTIMDELFIRDVSSQRFPEAIGFFTKDGFQIGHVSAGLAHQIRAKSIPINSIEVGFPLVDKQYKGGSYDEEGAYIGGGSWRYECETFLRHPDLIDEKEYNEQCRREQEEKERAEKEAQEKIIKRKLTIINAVVWAVILTVVGLIIKGISAFISLFK